jgi:hypothetical protein
MHTIREKALAGTSLAKAQFDTIRLKPLEIGAEVHELKTKLHFICQSTYKSELSKSFRRNPFPWFQTKKLSGNVKLVFATTALHL